MPEIMANSDRKVDKIGRLLHFASKGDVLSVKMLVDEGLPVDSPDYDGRTAMHLAACGGHYNVVYFLLKEANPSAHVNPVDRWRKTPLADARWYQKLKDNPAEKARYKRICTLLSNCGGSTSSPFEIDPAELKFQEEFLEECECGQIRLANWRGTNVSAKIVHRVVPYGCTSPKSDSELIRHLSLLQSCRHPNIVQFLGAVTNYRRKSLVLVTEHLPNGNLHDLLVSKKFRIQSKDAVKYALDIARGMNYLHQHKPEHIVHGELNPVNLAQDAGGHLKVAGINLSKLIGCICCRDTFVIQQVMYKPHKDKYFDYARYVAPEFDVDKPERSADVYSFGLIVHEMFEGPGFASSLAQVAAANRSGIDVPVPRTRFPPKLRQLLLDCCRRNPKLRPTFQDIIDRLEKIEEFMNKKSWWAPKPLQSLINNLTYRYRVCVLGARKRWGGSITPGEESLREIKSRRAHGQTKMITILEEG